MAMYVFICGQSNVEMLPCGDGGHDDDDDEERFVLLLAVTMLTVVMLMVMAMLIVDGMVSMLSTTMVVFAMVSCMLPPLMPMMLQILIGVEGDDVDVDDGGVDDH